LTFLVSACGFGFVSVDPPAGQNPTRMETIHRRIMGRDE
jgi:hypothetical protein